MKRHVLLTISIISIAIVGVILYFNNQKVVDERTAYENFLISEFQKLPFEDVEDLNKIPKMDRPDMAAIQDYYKIIDPKTKTVPTERLNNTREMMKEYESQDLRTDLSWTNVPCDMGGRTRYLMWDPHTANENKVWAGSVTGGLWYNNDITSEESSWHPVSDVWENLSISSIAYDPNNIDTYYVGSGEIETAIITYRESSTKGVGIWKSNDSGESWELLPSTKDFAYVSDVVVKADNDNSIIFAGIGSATYKGQDHMSLPEDGLYRSEDGGSSWEQVLPIIEGDTLHYTPNDILIGNSGKIFVGTMPNINGKGGATILMSETGEKDSWVIYEDIKLQIEYSTDYNLPGRVVLAAAPSEDEMVYAIIASGFNDGFGYYYGRNIIKTTDDGETWEYLNIPSNDEWATLAWHALAIEVDPNNSDHIFIGGLDEYKSSNGGNSWHIVSDWSAMYDGGGPDYVHADQHCIRFKPGSSSEAIFSTDGGVFYTNNAHMPNPAFQERNKDYNTLQYYSCDLSPQANHDKYIGGLQDNGCVLYDGDHPINHNSMVSGGDGAFCFFDDNDPNLFFTSVYYNRYYVFVNDYNSNYVGDNCGTFVCPADWDGESIIYANGCSFFGYHSDKIYRIKNLPNGENTSFVNIHTGTSVPFTAVNASQHNNNTLFVGSQTGRVYKVENMDTGSSKNAELISSIEMPVGSVSCVEIGNSEDTLLVTYSNYGVSSVWLTTNGGEDWIDVEGNLPDMPVRWAIFHPENSRQVLLATELGVWETHDVLADVVEWHPVTGGLPKVRVDMIKIRKADNMLLAGTHGRGLYTSNYPVFIDTKNVETDQFSVYPNPTQGAFKLQFDDRTERNISIYDVAGKLCYKKNNCSTDNLQINLQDAEKGVYLITIESNDRKATKKIIIE